MPSVLVDRYELRARVGSGGMATVWRAFDRRLGREVAVKVLTETLAADESFRHRFEREARHIASLAHSNIVVVHDFGTDGDRPFIVMELVKGKALRQSLAESSPLPPLVVADLASDVLAGLGHAHEAGILHRDIKPGNILVTESGVSKLADFGIAKATEETVDLTDSGAILGTVSYASPEQLSGATLGPPSDLYSLGCVLYECLAGRPPFVADNLAALVSHQQFATPEPLRVVSPEVPAGLAAATMRALEKEPGQRFASADAMKESLVGLVQGQPSRRHPMPTQRHPGAATASQGRNAPSASGPMFGVGRPTGTVTLLFSDIEGSTRLWEQAPGAMGSALKRHDELLRSAIEESGGYVFKTVGDAFCAAFTTAKEAVQAAASAQRALLAEPWPEEATLQVRMALHTGECEERDGDYFGPTLNRLARLQSVAHGAQVVISRATADVVRDRLPAGVGLRALGTHHLKDLSRPEEVFQIEIEGLNAEFPPLRSLDNPDLSNNLPIQLTSFVGREKEVIEIRALLGETRLLTLSGAGGSGKTRLALHVAAELVDASRDGVWFVDLAPLANSELVATSTALAIGIREQPERPIVQTLVDAVHDRNIVLVWDNCEHVVDSCAKLAQELLRSCPKVQILATSREPFGLAGERVYQVPTLSSPPDERLAISIEELGLFESIRLFCERAQDQQPQFVLDDQNAVAVQSVCRRLDGIPLAIELAAAKLRALSVNDIALRLDDRFELLTVGRRAAVPRHQTLTALIDWSYDLLTEHEQGLLGRLSVFAGGWDLEAVERVCSKIVPAGTGALDLLISLVEKSLVQADVTRSTTRYRLLETIRQYAAEKLSRKGQIEINEVRCAHATVYLDLAETASPHLAGDAQPNWFDRLELELDNIRAALSYWLADRSERAEALRTSVALRQFWFCGYWSEGIFWIDKALVESEPQHLGALRARALEISAYLHLEQGDTASFQTRLEELLALSKELGEPGPASAALGGLSLLASTRGDESSALQLADESVDLALISGDPFVAGEAFNHRGLARSRSRGVGAHEDLSQAAEWYRAADDTFGLARALQNLTLLDLKTGDIAGARRHIGEAAALLRPMHGRGMLVEQFTYVGLIEIIEGRISAAGEAFQEVVRIAQHSGSQTEAAYGLLGLAFCAHADGVHSRATTLHSAADRIFTSLGVALDRELASFRDQEQQQLRQRLGKKGFDAAWKAGRHLSTNDSLTFAQSASDAP